MYRRQKYGDIICHAQSDYIQQELKRIRELTWTRKQCTNSSHRMLNSMDCCVSIHTKLIPLNVVSLFIQNEFLWVLYQYPHTIVWFDFECCVNIQTQWFYFILSVESMFTHNDFILFWVLCQYSHTMILFSVLCQYSHKLNSFDCCVNIHTTWIHLTAV